MKTELENNILTIVLDERIDSVNDRQTEAELNAALDAAPNAALVLDAAALTYISSAGLRVLLRLHRKTPRKIRILNVRPEVYDIFEVTGFTELFDVRKKLREVSVDGCAVIGRGASGTVYRLEEDKILKLYHPFRTREEIEKERLLAREAVISGIPSVITYDMVHCGDSYGIVFEMLHSDTLGSAFTHAPERTEEYVGRYVDFVRQLHEIPLRSGVFPKLKTVLHEKVPALSSCCSGEELALLHSLIDSIPDRDTLVHGDLHPGNIMLQGEEFLLIDLPDVTVGGKVWDLIALFRDLIIGPRNIPDVIEQSTGIPVDRVRGIGRSFFMKYFGVSDESSLQPYFGMLMPLFALNSVLTSGNPSDPGHFVPAEIVKKMLREAITPNEEMIRQALQTLS